MHRSLQSTSSPGRGPGDGALFSGLSFDIVPLDSQFLMEFTLLLIILWSIAQEKLKNFFSQYTHKVNYASQNSYTIHQKLTSSNAYIEYNPTKTFEKKLSFIDALIAVIQLFRRHRKSF